MKRPSRLEILEYAKTGLITEIGTGDPSYEDYMDELEAHLEWIDQEIQRVKDKQ